MRRDNNKRVKRDRGNNEKCVCNYIINNDNSKGK